MAELNAAKQAEKSARIWLKKSKEHLKEVLEETPKVLERVSTAFTQVEKTMKDWEDAELDEVYRDTDCVRLSTNRKLPSIGLR